ncbi:hypothetical protein I4U23_027341 [Adineta vaga]|nr:hypothetical protein I4U23_027341 [Adineta vaga]
MNDNLRESIYTNAKITLDIDSQNTISIRSLLYMCSSTHRCNNQTIIQRLLGSMIIEDSFLENFSELIKQMPFDNSTAATCLWFRNVTSQCAQPDLNNCKRCTTNIYHSNSNNDTICVTCDTFNVDVNNMQR